MLVQRPAQCDVQHLHSSANEQRGNLLVEQFLGHGQLQNITFLVRLFHAWMLRVSAIVAWLDVGASRENDTIAHIEPPAPLSFPRREQDCHPSCPADRVNVFRRHRKVRLIMRGRSRMLRPTVRCYPNEWLHRHTVLYEPRPIFDRTSTIVASARTLASSAPLVITRFTSWSSSESNAVRMGASPSTTASATASLNVPY